MHKLRRPTKTILPPSLHQKISRFASYQVLVSNKIHKLPANFNNVSLALSFVKPCAFDITMTHFLRSVVLLHILCTLNFFLSYFIFSLLPGEHHCCTGTGTVL